MDETEKESIRTARANYAKRNISMANTTDGNEDSNTVNNPSLGSPPKRSHVADTSSAGDHMSRGRQYISQIRTGRRYNAESYRTVSAMNHRADNTLKEAKAELDSHADTTVAGSTCRVLEYSEKVCDVYPFSDSYQPMSQVPIAKVATAYDHPATGETFILIFGQALYLGDQLDHTLICPNQVRYNNIVVDDVPRHLSPNGNSTHSIYLPNEDIRLPLQLCGVISYIDTRYPSQQEINTCRWLVMKNDEDWQPYDESFHENEALLDGTHTIRDTPENIERQIYAIDADLAQQLHRACSTISTHGRKLRTTDETIAKIFGCNPQVATKTRQVTTQKGIQSMTDHLCR